MAFFFVASAPSIANEIYYVKDSVGIPIKSAPNGKTTQYLSNGDQVTVIGKQGTYSNILLSDGRNAWIESQFLQSTPSLKHKVPLLEEQVLQLTDKLQNIDSTHSAEFEQLRDSVAQLTQENTQLKQTNDHLVQVNAAQSKQIEELSETADSQKQDIFLKWFTRGGMVAGAAFIIGLLIPVLFRRKKSSWN